MVVIVDGANVMGSRPDGWWRDRPRAAERLHRDLLAAESTLGCDEVVLILEGRARGGSPAGRDGGVQTVHAAGSGDDSIVEHAAARSSGGDQVVVVTADRELRQRVAAVGASVVGPSWLMSRMQEGGNRATN